IEFDFFTSRKISHPRKYERAFHRDARSRASADLHEKQYARRSAAEAGSGGSGRCSGKWIGQSVWRVECVADRAESTDDGKTRRAAPGSVGAGAGAGCVSPGPAGGELGFRGGAVAVQFGDRAARAGYAT